MADFIEALNRVLVDEGGLVDDVADSGGVTKYGISKNSYPNVDIVNLTVAQAQQIYKKDYWDKIKGDHIQNQAIAYEIFDASVNMGVRTASKLAQAVIEAHPDGIIGEKTLSKLNITPAHQFVTEYKLVKVARYVHICKKNPKNRKFFFGWINRVLGV